MATEDKPYYTGEYKELTIEQKEDVRTHRDGLTCAQDYCKPYFEKAVRFCRLFDGYLPPELNSTFSKVMLNLAFSTVQNEIPRSTRAFTFEQYFKLKPQDPSLELYADEATNWLKYQMEQVQKLPRNIVAPLQSTHICGNGYMVYGHRYKPRTKIDRVESSRAMGIPVGFEDKESVVGVDSIITGQFAHFFSILPLPGGCNVNEVDDSSESVVDGLFWTHYMTEEKIKENVKKHGWNKDQVGWMIDKKGSDGNDPAQDYIGQLGDTTKGGMYGGDPQWISSIRGTNKNLSHRYRTEWFFKRDRWIVMGEGRYLLWAGKPLINAIPVANFRAMPVMNNWFGKSLIDVSEDIIIAILQNFNARLDYLAQQLHPTMYVSDRIVGHNGGDKSVFDPKPYNIVEFPGSITDIRTALFHDRYPELPQQAFIEQGELEKMKQKITGQPDYMSGLGSGSQADAHATGFQGLLSEGMAQSLMRSVNIENTGIMDCLWLTMKYASKYVDEDVLIRMEEAGGPPWVQIANEAITDGYGIEICGSKALSVQDEAFRKMLSMAPLLLNNQNVGNQKLLLKNMMDSAAVFEDVNAIIGPEQQMNPMLAMGGEEGGMSGAANGQGPIQNMTRSQTNRNTVNASGTTVPAAALMA